MSAFLSPSFELPASWGGRLRGLRSALFSPVGVSVRGWFPRASFRWSVGCLRRRRLWSALAWLWLFRCPLADWARVRVGSPFPWWVRWFVRPSALLFPPPLSRVSFVPSVVGPVPSSLAFVIRSVGPVRFARLWSRVCAWAWRRVPFD